MDARRLIALDEDAEIVRLGTCMRSPEKLVADLTRFDGHIARFLRDVPRFSGWTVQRVAIAPVLAGAERRAIEKRGFLAQDLEDLVSGL